jgi:hypothetical protein
VLAALRGNSVGPILLGQQERGDEHEIVEILERVIGDIFVAGSSSSSDLIDSLRW